MTGITMRMEYKGFTKLVHRLKKDPAEMTQALAAALYIEGQQLITEAQAITPVDEGILRASGIAKLPEFLGDGTIKVECGFGGPAGTGNNRKDVGYAVYVHEDLTARHTVGQAKYLEVPFNRRKAGFGLRISNRIRKRVVKPR